MSIFFNFLYNFRRLSLLSILLVVALLSFGIKNFKFDASSDTLVLENDTLFEQYEQTNEKFGESEFLVVAVDNEGSEFNYKFLEKISNLQEKLGALPEVTNALSILDAPLLQQPRVPLLKTDNNIKYFLKDDLNLSSSLDELINSPIFSNLIVNDAGNVFAIQLNLDEEYEFGAAVKRIRSTINDWDGVAYLAGPAMIVEDTINYIKSDVVIFGFVTFIIFSFLLFLFLKDFWATSVVMINSSLVLSSSMGLLGIFDWPISIVSSNFLALLLITSIAVSVHIIVKLQSVKNTRTNHIDAISEIIIPCLYTALTTIVGFGALMFSGIKPVIDFGKMMMIGVAVNFIISFVFIPTCIFFRPFVLARGDRLENFLFQFYLKTKSLLPTNPLTLILLALPIFLYLSTNLKVENKFIDYFQKDTEIYKGMSLIDGELGGTSPIDITLTIPEEGSDFDEYDLFFSEGSSVPEYWWKKDNMDVLKSIQENLNKLDGVGKVLSIANGIQLAEELNNYNELGDLELIFIKNTLLDSETASELIDSYITSDDREVRIGLRVKDSTDNLSREKLIKNIYKIVDEETANSNYSYQISGLGILYNNLLQSLFSSQIKSLIFVFGAIFFMLLMLFRNILRSFFILLIPAFSVSAILSIMSIMAIPLDIMTITIASISVGMSVDYSIHFAWRYIKEKMKNQKKNATSEAFSLSEKNTFELTGKAIFITGFTIILGFLILILSNFNPTILFGILSALAILISMKMTFIVMPRMLDLTIK
ncbi:MAG: MMPL family transporter [SAR86 cluster bacterium]|nr:MMPL family transporter [SAR86 cluster bacterium]